MTTRSPLRTALAIISAAALAVTLTGCLQLGRGDADRDDEGNVVEGSTIDIFELKVGDCIDDEGSGELQEIRVVPCNEPHGDEVIYEFNMREGAFPSDEEFDDAVYDNCIPAFETYVGIAWDDSTLGMYTMTPTPESWSDRRDRAVQCIVFDPEGQMTSSVKGAQR